MASAATIPTDHGDRISVLVERDPETHKPGVALLHERTGEPETWLWLHPDDVDVLRLLLDQAATEARADRAATEDCW